MITEQFNCGDKVSWTYFTNLKIAGKFKSVKSSKQGIFLTYLRDEKNNLWRDDFSGTGTSRALIYLFGNVCASKILISDLKKVI